MEFGPRVLTCIDAVPAPDGSCAQQAWLEQPAWVDYLPTVDQANAVGFATFVAVCTVVAFKRLLIKSSSTSEE